jgi:endonuclease YncB( thermonuclease family)
MRARAYAVAAALTALAACGPNIKGLEKGETGKVVAVSDGDTLTLNTGLKVQLTGIIAPRRGYKDRPDEPNAQQARETLEKIALGRRAQLAYGGEKRLGGKVALVQVFVQSEGGRWIWAQEAMLREGMARARTWRTNHARAAELFAAEDLARKARKGVWADKAYAVQSAGRIAADAQGFQEVEGVVRAVKVAKERTYLDFGEDYAKDFSIEVDAKDRAAWTPKDPTLESLKGKRIRVRGYVYDRGGPMIRIDHPQAIEVLSS